MDNLPHLHQSPVKTYPPIPMMPAALCEHLRTLAEKCMEEYIDVKKRKIKPSDFEKMIETKLTYLY